jgi:hypothetical protein
MVMRRLLGSVLPTLLLVAALGACGDEESVTATDDPTPVASGSPTESSTGDEVDFDLVDTITVTAAGGAVMPIAISMSDEASVAGFNAQFESDDMVQQVQDAVAGAEVPEGQALYAAVVAIGCDSPTDVSVTDTGSGLVITAQKVPSPMPECFAPMTTVALVLAAA